MTKLFKNIRMHIFKCIFVKNQRIYLLKIIPMSTIVRKISAPIIIGDRKNTKLTINTIGSYDKKKERPSFPRSLSDNNISWNKQERQKKNKV